MALRCPPHDFSRHRGHETYCVACGVNRRPNVKGNPVAWFIEMDDVLMNMRIAGISFIKIAERLGVSTDVTRIRARKLGLSTTRSLRKQQP